MATTSRAPVNEEEFLGALYKGGELLAAGKIVEARSQLEKAHQLSPKNEKAQNLLGLTYFKLGLFDQASDIYEKLVNENPADPTLRVNLGLVYLKTNNLPRCIKEFETATDLEPEHKKAHNYLGLALAQAGDYAKAKHHFVLAGSDQMAEKMARAISVKLESPPAVPAPPAPVAVAPPPLPPPASPPTEERRVVAEALSPPLPPAPAEQEIEVMSDADVMESDGTSGEQPLPEQAAPAPVEQMMPEEIEVSPPSPSGPRLDRDWGAQFGMDASSAPEVTTEELPVIEAAVAVPSRPNARRWAVPHVNSWSAAQGMSPPNRNAAPPQDAPDPLAPPAPPAEEMRVTSGDATEDPAWAAAKVESWQTAQELPPEPPPPALETPSEPSAQDMSWNVPPDPSQEMDFGGVAPADAPPPATNWAPDAGPEIADTSSSGEETYVPTLGAAQQAYEQQLQIEGAPPLEPAQFDANTQDPPAYEASSAYLAAQYTETTEVEAAQSAYEQPPDGYDPNATSVPAAGEYQEQAYQEQAYQEQAYQEQPYQEQPYQEQPYQEQAYQAEQPADGDGGQTAYDQGSEGQPQGYGYEGTDQATTEASYQAYDGAAQAQTEDQTTASYDASVAASGEEQHASAGPAWVAQPLSQFTPDSNPPPSAHTGYAPMEGRSLVDLGAATTDEIEQPNAGPFHVGPHGLAISVSGQILSRMTNMVAIVGGVTADPENKRNRGRSIDEPFGTGSNQMQRLKGHGVVHLEMGGARFHALDLSEDSAYLREERLFGFEESIGFEHGRLSDESGKLGLDLVHLSGSGRVLLQLDGAMKPLAVPPGAPMVVPLQRLVGWFGHITPRLTGFAGQGAVELTGDGHALLVTPG